MSEPVSVLAPLHGEDRELQALGACIHLLENTRYSRRAGYESLPLTIEQCHRIAQYLAARYPLPPVNAEVSE